jgi:hypothetical protein
MFRAFPRPSSGVQWLQWQPQVLPAYRGDSRVVFVVGPTITCYYSSATYLHHLCGNHHGVLQQYTEHIKFLTLFTKAPTFLNSEAQQTQTYNSFGSSHSKNYLPSYILFIYGNGLFPSDSSTKHFAPIHGLLIKATCFIALILIDLITLTIFCEDYELFTGFYCF